MPGYGETLVCEGDPRLDEEREALVDAFRRQLEEGMWAAVPVTDSGSGRREAVLVTDFDDIPQDAERSRSSERRSASSERRGGSCTHDGIARTARRRA